MIEQLVLLYFLGIIGMTIMQAPAKSKSHILIIVTSFSWPIAIPIIGLLTIIVSVLELIEKAMSGDDSEGNQC